MQTFFSNRKTAYLQLLLSIYNFEVGKHSSLSATQACYLKIHQVTSLFATLVVGHLVWPAIPLFSVLHFKFNLGGHGLRKPDKAFFHRNPRLLGLGKQFGQINVAAFGVFLANLSAPIWVHGTVSPLSILYLNRPLFISKSPLPGLSGV